MTMPPAAPAASRFALVFIFITMFLDTVGLGIIIPVLPQIIAHLTGPYPNNAAAMSAAANWGGWLMFAYAGMLFVFSPVIGNLSDRFGRKPVLIVSLLALCVDYLITGFAPTIMWLFVGRVLTGVAGAAYTTANAFIADVSPPEKRAQNFGLTGAAFGIGFVVGPAIGGLLGQIDLRLPFFVAAAFSLANAAFGMLVMKESLPPERRRRFEFWRANPVGSLVALSRFPALFGFFVIMVLMRLAHDANPTIWSYYVYYKFHWTTGQLGAAIAFLGLVMAFVFGFLTRIAIPKLGEHRAAYIGLFAGAIGFAGYAISTEGWMMYPWMAVWALMGLAMPSINGIMSKHVPPTEQGELQGALASLGAVTSIVAPLLLTRVFTWSTTACVGTTKVFGIAVPCTPVIFPGAGFLLAGLFLLAAAILLTRVERPPA